jgi:GntR family transcriptional regulator
MMKRGGAATSRVLEQAIVMPPPGVAAELNLAPGETAVKIVRLRLVEDTPLLLETIFVPVALCPGLEDEDLATKSLYSLLEQQYGLRLKRTRQTLEATTANEYEMELFDLNFDTPMILLEGVTYSGQGRPVEYFKAIYRGDRFKFELESQRNIVDEAHGAPRFSVVWM